MSCPSACGSHERHGHSAGSGSLCSSHLVPSFLLTAVDSEEVPPTAEPPEHRSLAERRASRCASSPSPPTHAFRCCQPSSERAALSLPAALWDTETSLPSAAADDENAPPQSGASVLPPNVRLERSLEVRAGKVTETGATPTGPPLAALRDTQRGREHQWNRCRASRTGAFSRESRRVCVVGPGCPHRPQRG